MADTGRMLREALASRAQKSQPPSQMETEDPPARGADVAPMPAHQHNGRVIDLDIDGWLGLGTISGMTT